MIRPEDWRIIEVAAGLISDPDDEQPNLEYDRGIVDMTCTLLDMPIEQRGQVEQALYAVARLMRVEA